MASHACLRGRSPPSIECFPGGDQGLTITRGLQSNGLHPNEMGVTTGLPSASLPYSAIEPLILLRHVEVPEGIPLAVEVGGPEVQHRLRTRRQPAHPRPLHPVLDQMTTRPLDHPTADRVTRRQILVVLHPIPVPLEISRRIPHRLPLLPLQTMLRGLVAQPTDH